MKIQSQSRPTSALIRGIDQSIRLLRRRYIDLSSALPISVRGSSGPEITSQSSTNTAANIALLMAKLQQVKDILEECPDILPLVDGCIGQQVRAKETRERFLNVRMAFATTCAGAILGWLTSLLGSPSTLLHLLAH